MVAPGRPTAPRRASSTPRDLTPGVKAEALASVSRMLIDLIMVKVVAVEELQVQAVPAQGNHTTLQTNSLRWSMHA